MYKCTAETCTGIRPQEASVGSFAIQEVVDADYGTEHKIPQATHAGVMELVHAKRKKPRSRWRQRSIREAKE